MDIIEHYIKNSSLVDIPDRKIDLLSEGGGIGSLGDLFTIDSKRDNKNTFLDKADKNDIRSNTNSHLPIKDKKLWKQMRDELVKANSADELVGWTGTDGKLSQLLGVTMSKIGKAYNGLSPVKGAVKPSGEDWEAMIAVALAFAKNKNADLSSGEYADEWKRINDKGFWGSPGLRSQAESLGDSFKSKGITSLQQIGGGKDTDSVSAEWKQAFDDAGRKDKPSRTPKTDVIGGGKKISLKMEGGSQIMSSKRVETFTTLEVAFKKFGGNQSSELKKVFDTLRSGILDTSKSGYKGPIDAFKKKVKKLKDDGSAKSLKELEEMKDQIQNVDDAEKAGNVISLNLNLAFQSNPKLKQEFVFEAATGDVKFGTTSDSRADTIVEFNPKSGKITDFYDIESKIADLTSKCHFYASFKTGSKSTPYIACRGNIMSSSEKAEKAAKSVIKRELDKLQEGKKDIEYLPTFSTIMREAFNNIDNGNKILNEHFHGLSEVELFNSMKSLMTEGFFDSVSKKSSELIKKGINLTKGGLKKIKDSTLIALEKAWKWVTSAINYAFEYILKQGDRAIRLLLKFFGVEVNKVDFSSNI